MNPIIDDLKKCYKQYIAIAILSCSAAYFIARHRINQEHAESLRAIIHETDVRLIRSQSNVLSDAGFEFSPGGGYFYFPNGNRALSQNQKDSIEQKVDSAINRIENDVLHRMKLKIEELEESYR